MTTRALNFLWINLDLPAPADPEDGSIRQPLPAKYIDNIRNASEAHPDTQMILWVDSRRLTERQYAFLQDALEDDRPNVHLKDLRSIPAYDKEELYNQAETDPNWRNGGQRAVIWRQVDAAKILVSLQGNFDQSFFADLDHAHLDVASEKVQTMLEKQNIMIGASSDTSLNVENQLWGFSRGGRRFFEDYYPAALRCAYRGHNAWQELKNRVKDLCRKKGIGPIEIILPIKDDGTRAEQPGHVWRSGYGSDLNGKPVTVEKGQLSRTFNEKSARTREACPDLDVVWTPKKGTYCQPRIIRFFNKLRDGMKPAGSII